MVPDGQKAGVHKLSVVCVATHQEINVQKLIATITINPAIDKNTGVRSTTGHDLCAHLAVDLSHREVGLWARYFR